MSNGEYTQMVQEEKLNKEDVDFSLISKDPRFENLTGEVFGDLVVLGPYKKEGKTLKWVVECSCGSIIKTSRTKLKQRGKTCCVTCSEAKRKCKYSKPLHEKMQVLLEERQDISRIINTDGNVWSSLWEVECALCHTNYTRSYRDLIGGVRGCACSPLKRKKLEDKILVVEDYCKKHNFIFKGWDLNSTIRVNLYCPKHNKTMNSSYFDIELGKLVCPLCFSEDYESPLKKTREAFIKEAKVIHGDKFNYDLVEYVNTNKKVIIKCNNCGALNYQTPAGHLSGRGCNTCKKTGFKPNKPCYLYILHLFGLCEEYYKVGITNNLRKRVNNLSRGSWFDITVIDFHLLEYGWQAQQIETTVLKELGVYQKGVIEKKYQPEGATETFYKKYYEKAIGLIEEELIKFNTRSK